MKKIRYSVAGYVTVYDYELEREVKREAAAVVETSWSEEREERARQIAIGNVEIFEDGENDPVVEDNQNPGVSDEAGVWDELDAAYQAGYHAGYQEGVNSVYDE